jgi:DNA gyrase subunit A
MRYTEARMSRISEEMLRDLDKNTVKFTSNFDDSLQEPLVLPAYLPNLLVNGASGIAVGMATNIPPHNLREVIDAIIELIAKPNCSNDDLIKFIKAPDFPTGGIIYGYEGVREAYNTGRGRIIVRAKANVEVTKNDRENIIITELPYQVNKANLIEKIAELVREGKINDISNIRDESDRDGMRVVIELKRDGQPAVILNQLFKHTQMQITFGVIMLALVNGAPKVLALKEMLQHFLLHRMDVLVRRTKYELEAAEKRAHILEGYIIALDNIDAVIETIKKSKDVETAKESLIRKFKLSEIQAKAILDMRLQRLTGLERKKIEDEYKSLQELIAYLTDLLLHPEKILKVITEELKVIREKYGDERRTKVYNGKVDEFSEEDLIPNVEQLVIVTRTGYIKRAEKSTYKTQKRGGKGVVGMKTKEEDEISHLLSANTHDSIMLFTNKGRVFRMKVWELPEGSRQSKGQAVVNLINIEQGEYLQSILTIPAQDTPQGFLFMATKNGTVKKSALSKFDNVRSSGIIAIKLDANDELVWTRITNGNEHILLVSYEGKSIKFSEKDVRPTARDTMGVRGILLKKEDYVVGMEIVPSEIKVPTDKRRKFFKDILVVTENGLGKRTDILEFPLQKRGGMGVKVAEVTAKTGKVICSQAVDESVEQIVLTSKQAQIIKLPLKNIPRLGRATQGVILMRFDKKSDDTVSAVTCLTDIDEEEK